MLQPSDLPHLRRIATFHTETSLENGREVENGEEEAVEGDNLIVKNPGISSFPKPPNPSCEQSVMTPSSTIFEPNFDIHLLRKRVIPEAQSIPHFFLSGQSLTQWRRVSTSPRANSALNRGRDSPMMERSKSRDGTMEGQPKEKFDILLGWDFPYPFPGDIAHSLVQNPLETRLGRVIAVRTIVPNEKVFSSRI